MQENTPTLACVFDSRQDWWMTSCCLLQISLLPACHNKKTRLGDILPQAKYLHCSIIEVWWSCDRCSFIFSFLSWQKCDPAWSSAVATERASGNDGQALKIGRNDKQGLERWTGQKSSRKSGHVHSNSMLCVNYWRGWSPLPSEYTVAPSQWRRPYAPWACTSIVGER